MAYQGSKNLDRRPVASQLIWEKEKESQGTEERATAGPPWEKGEQGPGLGQGVGVGGPEQQENLEASPTSSLDT